MKKNYLRLVNEDNKINDTERPTHLVQAPFAQTGVFIDPIVAIQLEKLVKATGLDGQIITIDGYRSKNTQQKLWDETIQEKGLDFANQYVAKPGCSEHELGLAVDLGLAMKENDFVRPSFTDSPIVDTFLAHMTEFGFILRYQKGNIALEKAERLEQLIGEFFEITRFNLTTMTVTKESVDISMMLEQLSYEFLPVLQEKKLEWQLAIEPNILGMIDPEKMERAFDNLIRNAIHYSFSNSKIHLSVQQQDEQIKINITNEGRHIPPEKITRIFEPFYRADSARQSTTGGTGLGLPITKEIVELHEGTISAVSEENQISFTVLLPIS